MQGVINIGFDATNIQKSDLLNPYSKVSIAVDETHEFVAGDDTGETLEIICPWGTQGMANDILAKIRGFQYQPVEVQGAIINPATELGDAVYANNVYSGLYQQDISFGRIMYSDFSAPQNEQLDSEFTFESPTERRITREKANTKAELEILDTAIRSEVQARTEEGNEFRATFEEQSNEIDAKVSQTGGENSTFGWSLVSTGFSLYSGNKTVFKCNSDGIEVDGKIVAKSGIIGAKADGTGGFKINANYMCTNDKPSYDDSTIAGIYIGTSGIGLGKGVFTVSSSGAVVCKSIKVSNDITFIDSNGKTSTLNASKLTNGSISEGKIGSGAVTSGKIGSGAVTDGKIGSDAVNTSNVKNGAVTKSKTDHGSAVTNGQTAYNFTQDLTASTAKVDTIRAKNINSTGTMQTTGTLYASNFRFKSQDCVWKSITINSTTYYVMCHN